ncbi:MAG: carbon-nitrogen hydrolase family protein, partial [Campylobacterales bacterium]|nr:carbon-nitrogen hydrolase family protein [Campylobacterales bacterium]
MKIAALQFSDLPMSESRIDYYLRICSQKGVRVVL